MSLYVCPLGPDTGGVVWGLYCTSRGTDDTVPEIQLAGSGGIRSDLAYAARFLALDTMLRWRNVIEGWLDLARQTRPQASVDEVHNRLWRTAERAIRVLDDSRVGGAIRWRSA